MKILVTGARGFVGAHLVSALEAVDAHVAALVRSSRGLPTDVRAVEGNILDGVGLATLLEKECYDTIFHLAGVNSGMDAVAIYQTNVVGTATLLQAVRSIGNPGMRVVLTGSSAEYGATPENPLTEDSRVEPVGDYGISKLAVTRMGQLLQAATGQATVMVRPFNVIGPGTGANLLHATVARQIVEIEEGKRPPVLKLRDLSGYRDFVDARDVAAGFVALAQCGLPGHVYNLCSGQAVQAATLVEQLVGLARVRISVEVEQTRGEFGDVSYQRGSFAKANGVAAWTPSINLEKSLTDTLNYWRKWRNAVPPGGRISEAISR